MVNVFDDLAMIDKTDNGKYKPGANALRRLIFQMGDVLATKKWHSLTFTILQQMTAISKEEYIELKILVYKSFFKIQNYLHENIHRLQGIYKLFYGGFIQPIQVMLGTKKVKFDPTKVSWKQHE